MSGIDPETRWICAPAAHVVLHRARVLIAGDDGSVRQLDGDSAALVEAVLELLAAPRDRAGVLAAVTALAGGEAPAPEVIDATLALLRDTGAICAAAEVAAAAPVAAPFAGVRVVLGITGSIGTLHTPLLVTALHRRGCDVRIAATRAALRFAPVAGLEALTHQRVVRSPWSQDPRAPVPHLALAAWADLMLICPATATTLARLATGDHACVVAAAALCAKVPVVVAPAMNPAMLDEPAVQRNLAQLRADGFHVVLPGLGVEIADAPGARVPRGGGAPPPERMVALALAVLRAEGVRARAAIDWEAAHAAAVIGPADLAVDDDVAAALAEHARPPGLLLDVGTGSGAIAIHAARAGWTVVATDLAPTALAHARAQAGGAPITWLADDVTDSRLHGEHAVVVDRGCLHHLAEAAQPRWAAAMARLVAGGGVLIVKTDGPDAAATRATRRFTPASLAALLGPAFAPVAARASHFVIRGAAVPATFAIFRRTQSPCRVPEGNL